jgi:hypothetical protein
MGRGSTVGIGTGYGLNDPSVKNFHFSISSRPALGSTQPPIQWVPGALSPGARRQGREADQSPPTSAEVKKPWIYTSTFPHDIVLSKAQGQIYFFLPISEIQLGAGVAQ